MNGWILGVVALLSAPPASAAFPTLDRTIQMARTRSLVVTDAEGELGAAHAEMKGASVSILHNPYSEIQIDNGFGPKGTGQTIQALSYTYFPFDLTGQRGARIDEAQRLVDWRKLGLIDAQAVATGRVVGAYGAVVVSAARIEQALQGEQNARAEANYFAGRLAAKDTTIYEKAIADAEVARWVQARAEAALRLTQTRAELAELTGVPITDLPDASIPVVPPSLRGPWDDGFVRQSVDRTPLIARLLAERQYWDASVDRYKSERIPPFIFEVIAGQGASGEARFGGGVVLTLPVTRRYQGEIARAEHGREHVSKHLELYRNIVSTRLVAARDAVRSARKAVEELDREGIPAFERAADAAVEAFKLGKIELTRVLLARRDLATARARRLDLIEASWRAYADLTIFSGGLP